MKKLLLLLPFITACSGHVDPDCFSDYSKVTVQEYVSEMLEVQAKHVGMSEEYQDVVLTLEGFRFKGQDTQTKQVWCEVDMIAQYKSNEPVNRTVAYTIELTEDPEYHYFNVEIQ